MKFSELEFLRSAAAVVEKFFPECSFLSEDEKVRILRLPADMAAGDADNLSEDRARHMRLRVEISWLDATLAYLVEQADQMMDRRRGDVVLQAVQGRDKSPPEHMLKVLVAADEQFNTWREEKAKRERIHKFVSGLAYAMGNRNDIMKSMSYEAVGNVGQQ